MPSLLATPSLGALAVAGAAALSVALWTFRVALAGRGRRLLSALVAGVEALLFVLVFTGLVANLGDPLKLAAYAVGVAFGTLLGILADERLTAGNSEVRLVVPGDGATLVERLHRAGWPATWMAGMGPEGPATSAFVVVEDRCVPELLALLDGLDLAPFVTVERLRQTRPVPLPAGFVQVGDRRARRHRVVTRAVRGRRPTPAAA
jgi:uncharacterized protein YebE (UPF0316 family)